MGLKCPCESHAFAVRGTSAGYAGWRECREFKECIRNVEPIAVISCGSMRGDSRY